MKHSKLVTMMAIILCCCALYLIIQSTTLKSELKLSANSDVIKLEIALFNPNRSQTYAIKDAPDIDRIMRILNDAILIPSYGNSRNWEFRPLESYEVLIYTSDEFYNYIRIYGNTYMGIEGRVYRIIRKSDVSKIYEIITAGSN